MYHDIVLLGVVLSIIFYELTGYSPAGLVVAGYLALCLQTPERIGYTFAVVLLSWGAVRLLARWIILYGRRRFAVMILISFAVNLLLSRSGLLGQTPGLIGCLVPGIIANEFERQGLLPSLLSLGVVTGLLALVMLWFGVPVLPAPPL